LVAFLLAVVSCGGGSSTPDPGAVCLKNSDCKSPLTCSFGRCTNSSNYGIYWSTTGTSVVTQSGNTFTGNTTDVP
jgi:hypothetical protein